MSSMGPGHSWDFGGDVAECFQVEGVKDDSRPSSRLKQLRRST